MSSIFFLLSSFFYYLESLDWFFSIFLEIIYKVLLSIFSSFSPIFLYYVSQILL